MIFENAHQFSHACEDHWIDLISDVLPENPLYLFYEEDSAACKLSALTLGWALKALKFNFHFIDVSDEEQAEAFFVPKEENPVAVMMLRTPYTRSRNLLKEFKNPRRVIVMMDSCLRQRKNKDIIADLEENAIVVDSAYMPLATTVALVTPLLESSRGMAFEDYPELSIAYEIYTFAYTRMLSPVLKRRTPALMEIIEKVPLDQLLAAVPFADYPAESGFIAWHHHNHRALAAQY